MVNILFKQNMPRVGKKHFPYTKKGMKEARKLAKKKGLKVKIPKNWTRMY